MSQTSHEIRRTAEINDDHELLPPEVEIQGEVPEGLRQAVEYAVSEEPNAVDHPVLREAKGSGHAVAYLNANFNELPVSDDGELKGWLPPYRAREKILEALHERLAEDEISVEVENNVRLGFYEL